jgi:hypothetical protein
MIKHMSMGLRPLAAGFEVLLAAAVATLAAKQAVKARVPAFARKMV